MTKLTYRKPPKNGNDFLGLVKNNTPYWDIFFLATKNYGVEKAQFVDSGLFTMPDIICWAELPEIPK